MNSNQDLNTFLLLMMVSMFAVFAGIWAFIGYLIIKGVRKTKRVVKQFTAYGRLPNFPISPVIQPAKYDQRPMQQMAPQPPPVTLMTPIAPVLRRVSTIIYTKEY